jgi:hypothetical protein
MHAPSRKTPMPDTNEAIANALELLMINQNGIGAAIEELAKWVAERGSTEIADNAVIALQVLDTNAEGIASAIRLLRSE